MIFKDSRTLRTFFSSLFLPLEMANTVNCGPYGDVELPASDSFLDGAGLHAAIEGAYGSLTNAIDGFGSKKLLDLGLANALAEYARRALQELVVKATGDDAEIKAELGDAIEEYLVYVILRITYAALGPEHNGASAPLGPLVAQLDSSDLDDVPSDAEMKRGKHGALAAFLVGMMGPDQKAMVAKLDPEAASGDDDAMGDTDYPFEPEDVQALIDNRDQPARWSIHQGAAGRRRHASARRPWHGVVTHVPVGADECRGAGTP
jgi:hypothetical protein